MSNLKILVKICNQQDKLLFGSDIESVELEATIGFERDYYDLGKIAGKKAAEIIIEKRDINLIDDVIVDKDKIKINQKNQTAKKIDMKILEDNYSFRVTR